MLDTNRLSLWLITGEASNNSGSGIHKVYTVTGSSGILPNVDLALNVAYPGSAWYHIESVVQISNSLILAADEHCGRESAI